MNSFKYYDCIIFTVLIILIISKKVKKETVDGTLKIRQINFVQSNRTF